MFIKKDRELVKEMAKFLADKEKSEVNSKHYRIAATLYLMSHGLNEKVCEEFTEVLVENIK